MLICTYSMVFCLRQRYFKIVIGSICSEKYQLTSTELYTQHKARKCKPAELKQHNTIIYCRSVDRVRSSCGRDLCWPRLHLVPPTGTGARSLAVA